MPKIYVQCTLCTRVKKSKGKMKKKTTLKQSSFTTVARDRTNVLYCMMIITHLSKYQDNHAGESVKFIHNL